jgi:hypothetical protein
MKTSYLLSLPIFFFTACATITRGVHEKLSVLSEPSGANVTLSSGERGVTPTKFVMSRRGDNFTVTVSKPGYIPQTVKVESKASATGETAMAGNIIVGGLIGAAVECHQRRIQLSLSKSGFCAFSFSGGTQPATFKHNEGQLTCARSFADSAINLLAAASRNSRLHKNPPVKTRFRFQRAG